MGCSNPNSSIALTISGAIPNSLNVVIICFYNLKCFSVGGYNLSFRAVYLLVIVV
jgi:hypothetical protein